MKLGWGQRPHGSKWVGGAAVPTAPRFLRPCLSTSGVAFLVIHGALYWLIMKPFSPDDELGLLTRKYALPASDTALMINDDAVTPQTMCFIAGDHPNPPVTELFTSVMALS